MPDAKTRGRHDFVDQWAFPNCRERAEIRGATFPVPQLPFRRFTLRFTCQRTKLTTCAGGRIRTTASSPPFHPRHPQIDTGRRLGEGDQGAEAGAHASSYACHAVPRRLLPCRKRESPPRIGRCRPARRGHRWCQGVFQPCSWPHPALPIRATSVLRRPQVDRVGSWRACRQDTLRHVRVRTPSSSIRQVEFA